MRVYRIGLWITKPKSFTMERMEDIESPSMNAMFSMVQALDVIWRT
jgi:hypothetical protein